MLSKPNVLLSVPSPLFEDLFSTQTIDRLNSLAEVTFNDDGRNWDSAEFAKKLIGMDAVITSWGRAPITVDMLDTAPSLKMIAHAAGSVKRLLPHEVYERKIAVTHGAGAIAPAVAELTLMLIMMCLRPLHESDQAMKEGQQSWREVKAAAMGQEIAYQRIGVVGAGYTGRSVIALLQALRAEVWVYDPYLSEAAAVDLGVKKVALEDLLSQCPIVTLQAPPTPETYHMIGAKELRLLADGAVFINTARGHLVDQDALLAELQTGRFRAGLDVFDPEPLAQDSPFRALPNAIILPHVGAATKQTRRRLGKAIVAEIERFFAGEPLLYEVTREKLAIMA